VNSPDDVIPAAAMAAGAFHIGELQAQALAGFATSGAAIRGFMPEQHRTFFNLLPYVMLATIDDDGWPLATMQVGEAGFIASPDDRTLTISITPDPHDPVLSHIEKGKMVGILGIDFKTRRRNRANGMVAGIEADQLRIEIHQSFGNCPKYIQVRDVAVRATLTQEPMPPQEFAGLDQAARALISSAATFFIATSSGSQPNAGGVDISHRGGAAGFVKVEGDSLICPDYLGNRYFNTLGNLLLEPRASLLFVDFSNGTLLHLRGKVSILWETAQIEAFPGAERLWRFEVVHAVRRNMLKHTLVELEVE
jgi:predicted pyridoxine 5'-phosphate oxidase superfamily flavin-nucleotide-binding protein